jgi:long-subunit fatty acid transport protein
MRTLNIAVLNALILAAATPSAAQNEGGPNNFDFSLPGARSRAIGGAFVAVADDATSVYSNPAGLTLLFRPEVSVEGRYWHLTTRAIDRGHGFGPASGLGVDTIGGFVEQGFQSNVGGLSFLSFVYPSDRWAVGVFRHQLSRNRMDRRIEGAFFDCSGGYRGVNPMPPFCEPHALGDGVDREFPKIQAYDLDIHSTGGAFAFDASEAVAIGVAVQYFGFSVEATNKVFAANGAQKYQPADFNDPQNLFAISTQTGNDTAWAVNAGALWDISDRWVLGASFRQGPTFEFVVDTRLGPSFGGMLVAREEDYPFHVPNTFSVGVLHKLTDFWRLSVEYDRINYHRLIARFRNTSLLPEDAELEYTTPRLRLDDVNQWRFGLEKLALLDSGRVFALRGGAWYDPNHQTYFDADEATGFPAPRWAVLLPKYPGSFHVSGGLGFTTRRHFQIDVAVDFSNAVSTLAISTVWRF